MLVVVLSLLVCWCAAEGLDNPTDPSRTWLLIEDQVPPGDLLVRRITPKSVFIVPPILKCPEGYRLDDMNRCVKIVKVDQAAQWQFFLNKLNSMFGSPPAGSPLGSRPMPSINSVPSNAEDDRGPFQVSIPFAKHNTSAKEPSSPNHVPNASGFAAESGSFSSNRFSLFSLAGTSKHNDSGDVNPANRTVSSSAVPVTATSPGPLQGVTSNPQLSVDSSSIGYAETNVEVEKKPFIIVVPNSSDIYVDTTTTESATTTTTEVTLPTTTEAVTSLNPTPVVYDEDNLNFTSLDSVGVDNSESVVVKKPFLIVVPNSSDVYDTTTQELPTTDTTGTTVPTIPTTATATVTDDADWASTTMFTDSATGLTYRYT